MTFKQTQEKWKKDSKVWEEIYRGAIQCKCSNKIPLSAFGERGVVECSWCHKLVYKDQEKQKEHDQKEKEYIQEKIKQQKKDIFEKTLRAYMKTSNDKLNDITNRNAKYSKGN